MRGSLLFTAIAACVAVSCSVFIVKDDVDRLKELEKASYILKKDVTVDGKVLKKGQEVRIKISTAKEWIKVHACDAKVDELKAEWVLVLYLFNEDFEGKKFSMERFTERLAELAERKTR